MEQQRMNPLIAAAAVALIIFSGVGVALMTGIIPSSFSRNSEHAPVALRDAAPAEPSPPAKAAHDTDAAKAPVRKKPVRAASSQPVETPGRASAPPAPPPVCLECGRIEAISLVQRQGEGTGLGAVAGGVIGGVLGNQVGAGTGRKLATVAGVAGGAYAGHQIEKQTKSTRRYDVSVRMENGALREVSYDAEPTFRVGDKVKIVNGMLLAG